MSPQPLCSRLSIRTRRASAERTSSERPLFFLSSQSSVLPWCLSANTRLASPNRIGFERKERQREAGLRGGGGKGGGGGYGWKQKGIKKRTRMCEEERHRERKE